MFGGISRVLSTRAKRGNQAVKRGTRVKRRQKIALPTGKTKSQWRSLFKGK